MKKCEGCNKDMTQEDILEHSFLYRRFYCRQCNKDFPHNTYTEEPKTPIADNYPKITVLNVLKMLPIIMFFVGLSWLMFVMFTTPPDLPAGNKISEIIIPATLVLCSWALMKTTCKNE